MPHEEQTSVCGLCLDYVTGTCTDEEKQAFERHLPDCPDCRAEIEELRTVWEALPADMERLEPPADLKEQVMNAVLAAEPAGRESKPAERKPSPFRRRNLYAVAAALAFVLFVSVWNYRLYEKRTAAVPASIEQALNVSASQIERLIPLRPQTAEPSDAYGVACVVGNGTGRQFIVYVFKAKATSGSEAYQVWLLRGSERKSAGTFRVGEKGVGVLAMSVDSPDSLAFDAIGITLEPDDRGNQPRGTKMFGSSL